MGTEFITPPAVIGPGIVFKPIVFRTFTANKGRPLRPRDNRGRLGWQAGRPNASTTNVRYTNTGVF